MIKAYEKNKERTDTYLIILMFIFVFFLGLTISNSWWKNHLIKEGHAKYELVSPEGDIKFKLIPMIQPKIVKKKK